MTDHEITPGTGSMNYMGQIARLWHSRGGEAARVAAGWQTMQRGVPPPDLAPPSGDAAPDLLIQAAIVTFGDKTTEGRLIEAVAIPWLEIVRKLARNPRFLHEIDWRTMEELFAGAYKKEGWPQVELTPRSGDKGRDVIATKPGFGSIRIIDQVKAYRPGHKVPADDVRALLGVLTREQNVSKGIVTTTSTFAPGIEDELKAFIPNRLELKDGPRLLEWLGGLMPSTL